MRDVTTASEEVRMASQPCWRDCYPYQDASLQVAQTPTVRDLDISNELITINNKEELQSSSALINNA